jgi:hypothetical protein
MKATCYTRVEDGKICDDGEMKNRGRVTLALAGEASQIRSGQLSSAFEKRVGTLRWMNVATEWPAEFSPFAWGYSDTVRSIAYLIIFYPFDHR